MSMINITLTPEPDLSHWQENLQASQSQINRAAVRALNKTARWMRTQVSRETAQSLKIKVGSVRKSLRLQRANTTRPEAGVGLPLKAGVMKAVNLGSAQQTTKGVRVGRYAWPGAFMATMPSGHKGVFKRKGKSRLPIREMHIVMTGRMAKAMELLAQGPALQRFEQLFEQELRFILSSG